MLRIVELLIRFPDPVGDLYFTDTDLPEPSEGDRLRNNEKNRDRIGNLSCTIFGNLIR